MRERGEERESQRREEYRDEERGGGGIESEIREGDTEPEKE